MTVMDELKAIAAEKSVQCRIEAKAFRIWLAKLKPANLLFVVGAALLSLLAGASVLTENGIVSATTAGIMALISSGLTLIHTKLGCDAHQAECARLGASNAGLAEGYANLAVMNDEAELRRKLEALDLERTSLVKSARATPSESAMSKAKAILRGGES